LISKFRIDKIGIWDMEQDNTLNQQQELALDHSLRHQTGDLSTEFLYQIINQVADPIFVKDRQHRWILVNDALCRILGRTPQELLGKSDYDFFPKTEADVFWEKDELVFTTGNMVQNAEFVTDVGGVSHYILTQKFFFEDRQKNQFIIGIIHDITKHYHVEADNSVTWDGLVIGAPTYNQTELELRNSQKKLACLSAITDITELNQAELQLREQEQFLRSIYEGVEHLIFVVDVLANGELIYAGWNSYAEKLTDISSADVIGKTPEQIFGMEEGTAVRQRFNKSLKTGKSNTYEEALTINEQKNWFITTINPLKNSAGKIYRLVGTTINISKRKKAETQLKKQTANLERAMEELQQAQIQVIQSEKMSGLGQLVAGIAHEINNPVNFIYGNITYANEYIQDLVRLVKLYQEYFTKSVPQIDALIEEIDLDFIIEDLPKLLHSMEVGADRIREIVISLRTFSRMDEAEMKVVNIHEGIDSTLMILNHRLKITPNRQAIEVIKEYSQLPLVECYPGQLNQVFMNIIANAIDAMEDAILKGDMVRDPQIRIITQLLGTDKVSINIIDNGIGITEDIKSRLFDPFFTTKPIGKGTGMGLSISYQIVTQRHGGSLECISCPGSGATFAITIPLRQTEITKIND